MTETNTGPTGADLSRADLAGADLRGRDLSKARLDGRNMTGAILTGANLTDANLKFANLNNANLEDAILERTYLRDVDLTRANLTRANLREASLQGARMAGANLEGADLHRTILVKADLTEANLSETNLAETNLGGAILRKAKFINTTLVGARLMDTDLQEAQLQGARLNDAKLMGAHLEGADLLRSIMIKANLEGAFLMKATLGSANLHEAILAKVNAAGADFTDANLHGADFKGAILTGAELAGADLFLAYFAEADLEGANLVGAKHIQSANFGNCNWYKAKLAPEDFKVLEEKYPIPKSTVAMANQSAQAGLSGQSKTDESEWDIEFNLGGDDEQTEEEIGRTITIFFSDMKASTDYMDKVGLEAGAMKIETHNQIVFPLIEKRGKIVKTMGDGIMARFDDPVDAVLAGIKIQQQLTLYNQGRAAKDPQRIEVRIGINTGRVLIREVGGQLDLLGPAVNEAARVQAQADVGEILVTRTVFGLVKDSRLFRCQPKGEYDLKGVSGKQLLYQIQWRANAPVGSSGSS